MDHEPRFHGEVSEKSHKTMSRIKGKDTKSEVLLRKYLWHNGIRYKKNYSGLPGTPDIVIPKYKMVIFCDSEFFHGKDWEKQKSKIEKGSNSDYWVKKIERNMERDRQKDALLKAKGWIVLHFWSKEIEKDIEGCYYRIIEAINDCYDGYFDN